MPRVRGVMVGVLLEVVCLLVVGLLMQIRPEESSNIPSLSAVEVYHSRQRVCANDDASENIACIVVTLDTCHLEMSTLNDVAEANIPSMLVTRDTSHLDRSTLNDDAEWNIADMVVTLDTSHLDMSPLNNEQ